MSAFTADENHLTFLDCFGLTRLSLPGRIKTDRTVSGSALRPCSLSADDRTLLVGGEPGSRARRWAFPSLRRLPHRSAPGHLPAALSADGQHTVGLDIHGVLQVTPTDGGPANAHPLPGAVPPPLYSTADRPAAPQPVALGRSGAMMAWRYQTRELFTGRLDGGLPTITERQELHGGGLLFLHPGPGCFVRFHCGTAALNHSGSTTALPSIALPAVTADSIVVQPTPTTLCQYDWSGALLSQHTLPADDAGPGRIFASASRLLFLPWHRESIRDLVTGRSISRKLPAAAAVPRRAVLAAVVPLQQAALPAGAVFDVAELKLEAQRVHVSLSCHASAPSLLASVLVTALMRTLQQPPAPGWSVGSTGMRGGIPRAEAPITEDEMVTTLVTMDDLGLPLRDLLSTLVGSRIKVGDAAAAVLREAQEG